MVWKPLSCIQHNLFCAAMKGVHGEAWIIYAPPYVMVYWWDLRCDRQHRPCRAGALALIFILIALTQRLLVPLTNIKPPFFGPSVWGCVFVSPCGRGIAYAVMPSRPKAFSLADGFVRGAAEGFSWRLGHWKLGNWGQATNIPPVACRRLRELRWLFLWCKICCVCVLNSFLVYRPGLISICWLYGIRRAPGAFRRL